jgi:hypothetical protein
MNRSVVKHMMGQYKASKLDYDEAMKKVREYRAKNMSPDAMSFADTTKKYNSLLALDADFAKKDFNDELLQNRDINVRLRDLYKFSLSNSRDDVNYALNRGYENPLLMKFLSDMPVPVVVANSSQMLSDETLAGAKAVAWSGDSPKAYFLKALHEAEMKQFLEHYPTKNIWQGAFIDRMDYAYAISDVVISRSGACTISELCLAGKPTLFVPSPNVSEDHQTKNAQALVDKMAARMVADSEAVDCAMSTALRMVADEGELTMLSKNIAKLAIADSAERVAREALKYCKE